MGLIIALVLISNVLKRGSCDWRSLAKSPDGVWFEKDRSWSGDLHQVDSMALPDAKQDGPLTCLKYCWMDPKCDHFIIGVNQPPDMCRLTSSKEMGDKVSFSNVHMYRVVEQKETKPNKRVVVSKNVKPLVPDWNQHSLEESTDACPLRSYCKWILRHDLPPSLSSEVGVWQEPLFCPKDSWVYAVQLKVESFRIPIEDNPGFDKAGLTNIKLDCRDINNKWTGKLFATTGIDWGSWKNAKTCPTGKLMSSFRYRSMGRHRFQANDGKWYDDNVFGTDLKMGCHYKNVGNYDSGGLDYGSWSSHSNCPVGQFVCGFQVMLDSQVGEADAVGISHVRFFCC